MCGGRTKKHTNQRNARAHKHKQSKQTKKGTYKITNVVNVRRQVVLRGAGRGATKLWLPRSLSEARGNSWRGGELCSVVVVVLWSGRERSLERS